MDLKQLSGVSLNECASLDELWNLHEEVIAELTRKITLEKAKLDERLRKIKATSSTTKASTESGDPIRRSLPNTAIQTIQRRLGRAVASNHAGWRLSSGRARSWISF